MKLRISSCTKSTATKRASILPEKASKKFSFSLFFRQDLFENQPINLRCYKFTPQKYCLWKSADGSLRRVLRRALWSTIWLQKVFEKLCFHGFFRQNNVKSLRQFSLLWFFATLVLSSSASQLCKLQPWGLLISYFLWKIMRNWRNYSDSWKLARNLSFLSYKLGLYTVCLCSPRSSNHRALLRLSISEVFFSVEVTYQLNFWTLKIFRKTLVSAE